MGRIEEFIEIIGADRAEALLGRVADAQRQVGDAAEDAGRKGAQAGKGMSELDAVFAGIANSAKGMIAGFVGFNTVLNVAREYLSVLQEIRKIQEEMADAAVKYATDAGRLGASLHVSEERGAEVLHQIQVAGGMAPGEGRQFGQAANAVFKGKLLDSGNLATAMAIAAFAGTQGMEGDQAAQLLRLIGAAGKAGGMDDAKAAAAQIAAAATAGGASNLGAFVEQVTRGGTDLMTGGASLEDVLLLAAQARQREGTDEKAVGTMRRLAGAGEQGGGLSARGIAAGAQRARGTAEGAAADAAIRAATAAAFDAAVEAGRSDVAYRAARTDAEIGYSGFVAGSPLVGLRNMRKLAQQLVKEKRDSGAIGSWEAMWSSPEALEEREMLVLLEESAAREMGRVGTPEDLAELANIRGGLTRWANAGKWNARIGYLDDALRKFAEKIDQMEARPSNVTLVNTQNVAVDPGRQNVPPIPVHQ